MVKIPVVRSLCIVFDLKGGNIGLSEKNEQNLRKVLTECFLPFLSLSRLINTK